MAALKGAPGYIYSLVLEHPVVLTRGFWIQQTEVTVLQWREIMDTWVNPSPYKGCGDQCPVTSLTVFDMMSFANKMSVRDGYKNCYVMEECGEILDSKNGLICAKGIFLGPDCTGYRLPSAAELELAIGGSSEEVLPTGTCMLNPNFGEDPLSDVAKAAWFRGNSEVTYENCVPTDVFDSKLVRHIKCLGPHPVGQLKPNRFGIYDGMGNLEDVTGTTFWDAGESGLRIDPGYDKVVPDGGDGVGAAAGHCTITKGGFFVATDSVLVPAGEGMFCWASSRDAEYASSTFRLVRTDTVGR